MKTTRISTIFLCLLIASFPAVVASGSSGEPASPYLTEPSSQAPLDIALTYLNGHVGELGLTVGDLSDLVVKDRVYTRHNGVTHLYLRQRLDGVEVYNGDIHVHVDREGRIFHLGNAFATNLRGQVNTQAPSLDAGEAIRRAAAHLRLPTSDTPVVREVLGGPDRATVYESSALSREPIPAKLMYEPRPGGARLVWNLEIQTLDSQHWWNLRIDAETGDILGKHDWVTQDSYRVFPFPFGNPENPGATHSLVVNPADPAASPFGWHDDDGVAGAEYMDTRGNNVWAQDDTDANNSGGFRPPANGPNLTFDYAWDPTLGPTGGTNQEAAIVNLFYWNNIIHDVLHHYGFDEAGGNFQQLHYGAGGGAAGDPVQADAQDGSGTNNANFSTPPDGFDPRMQMFVWTDPLPNFLTINSPGGIAGNYAASGAAFGPAATVGGATGDVVLGQDGVGTSSDGCEALTNGAAINGNIALIDRGNCSFVIKVNNAQAVGAAAVIIVNNQGDIPVTLGGADPSVTTPSGMIGQSDGDLIKAELLLGTVNGTFRNKGGAAPPNRDSDMDAEVIIHEYGHGISNRLTGGPANAGCLSGQEQMGEGWSDFYALALTTQPGHDGVTPRGMAHYVAYQPSTGPGIRTRPYSTSFDLNEYTYTDINGLSVPHGVGSVWAAILWNMHWDMVDEYGFDPDLYTGTGGNNRAIQLVTDGMKLQGCLPDFVTGRNGILMADTVNNGGADQCLIWNAFARRGVGFSAAAGTLAVGDETEAFDLPAACDFIFADGFEGGNANNFSTVLDSSGDLAVTGAAALTGSLGAAITINDNERIWVQEELSLREGRYRGRFYFDPNSLTMDNGTRQRIFQLFSDHPSTVRLLTGVLRWVNGGFKFQLKVRQDNGTKMNTGFVDITDAPHFIEFHWVKATKPGANDGSFEMFIDGGSAGTVLTGLDNDLHEADRARMGVVNQPKPGTSGTFYFDDLESHRITGVGP